MGRIASRRIYGTDGAGVRRRFSEGQPIPAGIELEEPLPAGDGTPEEQAITRRKAASGRTTGPDLSELKMGELRERAAEVGISVPVGTTKAALVEQLQEAN